MIFFKHTSLDNNKVSFQAIEDDIVLGECTLVLSEQVADVTSLSYSLQAPYVVEGLLRSAYNYAALKNYYMAKCSAKNINHFLDKMNFQFSQNEYIGDIPTILKGSCCK